MGEIDRALDHFNRAISLNKYYADAYNNKAVALENLKKPDDALVVIDKAIKINSYNPAYLVNKSSILGNLGRYVDAIKACDNALKIDADSKEAWYNKGYFEAKTEVSQKIPNNHHSIFISYATSNMEIAYNICKFFESKDIFCWIAPRNINFIDSWPGQITRAIKTSKMLFLTLSNDSNNSDQVLKEVNIANRMKIPRFSFQIDDVKISDDLTFLITDKQIYDATLGDLSQHLSKILNDIKKIIQ